MLSRLYGSCLRKNLLYYQDFQSHFAVDIFLMNYLFFILTWAMLLLFHIAAFAQKQQYCNRPSSGPGSAEYHHRSVVFSDFADSADGYWLFEPTDPKPDSAYVVIFFHGYGAYNPMVYGKWIKHLVARGNIVIYPRYQLNLLIPMARHFPKNAAQGIRSALETLNTADHVRPRLSSVCYIGHSYGGVIAAYLGTKWESLKAPKPASMLLCEPGTGPLSGARLKSYQKLPSALALNIVVGKDDTVVGDEFGRLVFNTAQNTEDRNLVIQYRDTDGQRHIFASHSEPYSCDFDFDTGVRNYTTKRALLQSRLNEVDFYCYWKFADALKDFTRNKSSRDMCFGNTVMQRFLGEWPDGRCIRELEVLVPHDGENAKTAELKN